MDENSGDLSLFNQLVGKNPPEQQQQRPNNPQPQGVRPMFPWGPNWIDIQNDFLFEGDD
jgi:hypothetical protein